MAQVQGHCDPKFEELRTLLHQFVESGQEVGASIAVNVGGQNVVDIWAGHTDEARTRPWERDTIVNVFSSTKTVTSLATLMLVDRGLLDVYQKVSKYWPEFAVNGKEAIEVRHFLSHTSGVSGWQDPVTMEDILDFERATAKLAQQAPWWTPGTASGYHAWAMGHLLGEIVRRVDGRTLKQFVAEDIAGPLDADFQIGALEKDWPRITSVIPPPPPPEPPAFDPNSVAGKTLLNPIPDANISNTPIWRRAELGAANGHGNARSLVRVLSAITLGGEVDGKRLLSQKTIDLIFEEQAKGVDLVVPVPIRFGIGYGLTSDGDTLVDDWLPAGRVCFWGGWGGSMIIMDLDRQVTIGYAMNKMSGIGLGNDAVIAYAKAIYKALGVDLQRSGSAPRSQ